VVCSLLLAAGASGCGPSPAAPRRPDPKAAEEQALREYRDLLRDEVAARENILAILTAVKDQASMAPALTQLSAYYKTVADVDIRKTLMGAPPPTVKPRLQEEFGDKLVALLGQIEEQAVRIRGLPGGPQFFDAVEELKKAPGR
jgi:hypothetical protein